MAKWGFFGVADMPRLPFANDPDIALGIAVKTFMDDISPSETREERIAKMEEFPTKFVPYATHFVEDLRICFAFFESVHAGVQMLDKEMSSVDRTAWDKAYEYLQARKC
jgi:Temperature dependent protein affecting M2 dsRNA replication